MELIQRAQRPGYWGSKKSIYFTEKEHQIRFFVSFLGDGKKKRSSDFSKIISKHAVGEAKSLSVVPCLYSKIYQIKTHR
jgi:hypothetical protein